jgi:Zn-dependent peptidase ImmA (M78 family)
MVFGVEKARFATAMGTARDLLKKTKIKLPVDVYRIAEILDYRVEEAEIRWAGYLAAGEKSIVIKRSDAPHRKRFTIAHEIGHVIWRNTFESTTKRKRLFKDGPHSEEERIANKLATELLMPMPEFQAELKGYTYPSFQMATYVARMFDVSFTACVRRITEVPSMLAFMYSYEIFENTKSQYNIRPKQQYSTQNELRFLTPPIGVVQNCLEHNLRTNEVWNGNVRFQMGNVQVQIPSVGRVSSLSRQTYVTLLGWRHLDSPIQSKMQANQLVAF